MGDKLTQKQENFTQDVFLGMKQRDAYIKNYHVKYAITTIDANASRLASNAKVLVRLKELRQKAEDASVATVIERKQVLTEILRARQTDYMTCSADGVWMHDIGKESLNSAALKKIHTTTMPFGDKDSELKIILTEVELSDKVRAIKELNKMEGVYNDSPIIINDNRKVEINGLTDEELAAIISREGGAGIIEEAQST